MTTWETAVCQRAVALEAFGKEHQLIICMEEMAELTKELTKHLRGRDNIPQIAEEVADVEIMLEQLKILLICGTPLLTPKRPSSSVCKK